MQEALLSARVSRLAEAAEMPIEYPSYFELALNHGAAQAIGLTVLESVRIQATEIIQ